LHRVESLVPAALLVAIVGAGAWLLQDAAPPAAPKPSPAWSFQNVVADSGVAFHHTFGDDRFSKILEDTGSGVALIDCDGDGLEDLFLSSGHWIEGLSDKDFKEKTADGRSRLYKNLGSFKFRDVTDEAGIHERGFGMGAVVGDYDGDGDEDLYVLNWGANVLYRNDGGPAKGGPRFTDVTAAAGVAGPEQLNGQSKWSVNGFFFDYDRDGDEDLWVSNYLAFDRSYRDPNLPKEYPYEGPESYRGQQSQLYRNEGDGTFVDVTAAVGLTFPGGKTMGAVPCDFDGDGDLDVFAALDSMPNVLWRNDGGRFVESAADAGVALDKNGKPMASMHGTVGDLDGDGRFDLFVPNLEEGCLFRNLLPPSGAAKAAAAPKLSFDEEGRARGVAAVLKGSGAWGSQFADFDLDGDDDLLVVLGGAFDLGAGEHDRLFQNDGSGRFKDLSAGLGSAFAEKWVSRGAAFGDLDNDGDVDYVVNVKDYGAPCRVVRNDLAHGAATHWLSVELIGSGRDRDAIGAVVALTAAGRTRWKTVVRANSYLSQCDARLLFGLGEVTKVDRLSITWPDGSRQEAQVDAVDRPLRIEQRAPGKSGQ
jgi:enediyne biosynthesis protein E4